MEFTWQAGRKLAGMQKSGTSATYKYNSDGIRTEKVVNGIKTVYYIVDNAIVAESRSNGVNILYLFDESGTRIGMTYNGQNYYYMFNAQGDVTALMNSSGAVEYRYVYDAWGKLVGIYNGSGQEVTNNTALTNVGYHNPIRYRGYYYDNETGFYYCNSRYYDPEVGRFVSPDTTDVLTVTPMGLTDKNLYAYCDNNPVVRVDRGGQFWETVFDVISLVASAVEVCINPTDPWAWAGLAGDVIDLIPFVTGVGEVTRAVKTVNKVSDVVDTTYDIAKTANRVENVVDTSASGIRYTDKVIKQMNNTADLNHAFPSVIDTFVDINSGRPLKGGDGIMRNLIELPGSINNTPGVFEYIIEPNGMCNHRYFKDFRKLR